MPNQEHQPQRQSFRVRGYDYSTPGYYFVTICIEDHKRLFGEVIDGAMCLNHLGRIAQSMWSTLPKRFSCVELDDYVIMPNHMHGIIVLKEMLPPPYKSRDFSRVPERFQAHMQAEEDKRQADMLRQANTSPKSIALGKVVRAYKGVTRYYIHRASGGSDFTWQDLYHEIIIRNDKILNKLRRYIHNNPARWAEDKLFVP